MTPITIAALEGTPYRRVLGGALTVLTAGCSNGVDSKLSTELSQAHLVPFAWVDSAGKEVRSTTNPRPDQVCALRLRDTKTGKEYAIQSSRYNVNPTAPADSQRGTWQGDYLPYLPGTTPGRASHRVRIECPTWRVLGVVPAGA
jgi:uncharacterized protein YfiM (DUF2279 family)